MITDPQSLNRNQTTLRNALTGSKNHETAIALFLDQHAALHSAQVTPDVPWSYEDEILDDITEEQFRCIPANKEHSVAWCIWHLARIEDVTMNMLLAGSPQLLFSGGWFESLKIPFRDTGNAFTPDEMAAVSKNVDLQSLRGYRVAVGRQTRQIVLHLAPGDLKKKVDSTRFRKMLEENAVTAETHWLIDYWGNLTITGLLLMPPTRHCISHLNEAAQLKRKRA